MNSGTVQYTHTHDLTTVPIYIYFDMCIIAHVCMNMCVCQCRRCKRHEFDPQVEKIPWRRKWQPTPAFLPEKSHGQRSLAGYSPCGHKESDTTEQLTIHLLIYTGQGASGHSCDSLPGPLFILEEGLYPQKGEQMWQCREVTKHKNTPPRPYRILTCHVIKKYLHLRSLTVFNTFDRQVVCQAL